MSRGGMYTRGSGGSIAGGRVGIPEGGDRYTRLQEAGMPESGGGGGYARGQGWV